MARRDIALGDGDEAGQPRFRGQQIVAIGVETSFRHAVADRQELALGLEQEVEFHRFEHIARHVADGDQPALYGAGGARRSLECVDQGCGAGQRIAARVCPCREFQPMLGHDADGRLAKIGQIGERRDRVEQQSQALVGRRVGLGQ